MQKISTFLWFKDNAEAAAKHYVAIFKPAKGTKVIRSNPMATTFTLAGREFTALNGNNQQAFNPSVSFYVDCKDQKEVDRLWARLLAGGGKELRCGWLQDKYGVAWQIIPRALPRLMGGKDRAKANRVIAAMMKMQKLDVAALEAAARG